MFRTRYGVISRFRRLIGIVAGLAVCAGVMIGRLHAQPEVAKKAFEFSERVVAGEKVDLVTVRHLKMKGSQREIGKKLGEIAANRHRATPTKTDPIVLRARQDFYRKHYPMHWQRSLGAAEAFGLDPSKLELDTTRLWFNMEPPSGCSVVYYPNGFTELGHAMLSRNYDFSTGTFAELMGGKPPEGARAMTGDIYVMENYPDEGFPSLFICAHDLLTGALDGMNSEGLTVALLADGELMGGSDQLMTVQAGLNQLELPRFLLETCANVEDAKAALMATKQYYLFIPAHFIIGDRNGKSFVWEYGASHNREYVTDGRGRPQVITNHSIFRYEGAGEIPKQDEPLGTYSRQRRMQGEIAKRGNRLKLDDLKDVNGCVRASGPPSGGSPERTLWHAVYDCTDLTLEVDFYLGENKGAAQGQERRSGYLSFRLDRGR